MKDIVLSAQMPVPAFPEVRMTRVPPMRFPNPATQSILACQHRNQVHMVRHQAVRPELRLPLGGPLAHQLRIRFIVPIYQERPLGTIPALSNVVEHSRRQYSR